MTDNKSQALNHLQHERSPYLLQHAQNPVDWYPWGDEALTKAQTENKPIFISIGYSTCHWCHVMAHESFEDNLVAHKLKQSFVSIKVDREERPDIDAGFMQACQLMNGQGGWPLNLFLTPAGKPFYALTYAPKHTQGQHPGFIEIIDKIAELWENQPNSLIDAGQQLSTAILSVELHSNQEELNADILKRAAESYRKFYDPEHAGFGQAPKFPQPHNPSLLIRLAQRFAESSLEEMALQTLRHIEQGGITDQIGGGMHRYSVDELWRVPHFEKMLYDQALIGDAYLDAWQTTGESYFKDAAINICDYVLRELQHPDGGFYCGEDADSEGVEGTYYLWTLKELEKVLNNDEIDFFSDIYNLTLQGNFEGKNIPYRSLPLSHYSRKYRLSEDELRRKLEEISAKLLLVRNQRPHPHLDDKILTGWNGLMIATLARAGFLLDRSDYLAAAKNAMAFIRRHLLTQGQLKRRYRAGETSIAAFHEDYAYLIRGLIELFLTEFNPEDLELALSLTDRCEQLFADGEGGFYDAAEAFTEGMGRGRNKQDGAIPAAASVTAHNLIRLARLTGATNLEEQAQKLLRLHLSHADQHPTAFAFLLQALDLYLSEQFSLVIVTPNHECPENWLAEVRKFRPQMSIILTSEPQKLSTLLPSMAVKKTINGKITAWFCNASSCLEPVTQLQELRQLLESYAPLKTFSK